MEYFKVMKERVKSAKKDVGFLIQFQKGEITYKEMKNLMIYNYVNNHKKTRYNLSMIDCFCEYIDNNEGWTSKESKNKSSGSMMTAILDIDNLVADLDFLTHSQIDELYLFTSKELKK